MLVRLRRAVGLAEGREALRVEDMELGSVRESDLHSSVEEGIDLEVDSLPAAARSSELEDIGFGLGLEEGAVAGCREVAGSGCIEAGLRNSYCSTCLL
jgi:hypothetical protein